VSVVTSVVDEVLELHGAAAYTLVAGLSFAEAALFVGFVVPGETAVLLGGVLADQHQVSLAGIAAVAVAGAIVGDTVGYTVGRQFGPRVLEFRVFAKRRRSIQRGLDAVRRNGGRAVFLARFTAFFRAVMPGLAGAARMPYARFLAFNAVGGFVWAVGMTSLGFAAGAGYKSVVRVVGSAGEVILVVVLLAALALVIRRHRRSRDSVVSERNSHAGSAGGTFPVGSRDQVVGSPRCGRCRNRHPGRLAAPS
jgi:membrane protein DedA with SNARE-associated domain